MIYLLFFITFFLLPKNAYAYLDPGTGSYLIQIVIATLLGSFYLFRIQISRLIKLVKNLLTKLFKKNQLSNEN